MLFARPRPSPASPDAHRILRDVPRLRPTTGSSAIGHDLAPVTWSPTALNARLDAERALHALPRRARGFGADARIAISRIIAGVEHRRLTLRAATTQLRAITLRLREYHAAREAQHAPRAWELLGGTSSTRTVSGAGGLSGGSARWLALG